MDSIVTSAWLISGYVDVLMISLGKWCTWTIMCILLIFLSLLLLPLILSFLLMLMFSGGWLQAIVTHWSVPVHFEQLSCHHHKTLSKFLVQPPYPPKKTKFVYFCTAKFAGFALPDFWRLSNGLFRSFLEPNFSYSKAVDMIHRVKPSKTRSLVNLSDWSALSILIHRALVTQSTQSAFGCLGVWHHF